MSIVFRFLAVLWLGIVSFAYIYFNDHPIISLVALATAGFISIVWLLAYKHFTLPKEFYISFIRLGLILIFGEWVLLVIGQLFFGVSVDIGTALYTLSLVAKINIFILLVWIYLAALGKKIKQYILHDFDMPVFFMPVFGLAVLLWVLYVIAFLQWFVPMVIIGLLALSCALVYKEIFSLGKNIWQGGYTVHASGSQKNAWVVWGMHIGGLVLGMFATILTIRPLPLILDDMASYYRVPDLITKLGGLVPFFDSMTAAHTGSGVLLYAGLYTFIPEYFIHGLMVLFWIMVLGVVWHTTRLMWNKKSADIATVVLMTVPWSLCYLKTQKVIFIFLIFSLVAVYAYVRFIREKRTEWLYLTAFFLGSALAVKINALFLIVAFGVVFIWLVVLKKISIRSLMLAFVFGTIAFAPVGLFHIYQYHDPLIITPGIYTKHNALFASGNQVHMIDILKYSKLRTTFVDDYFNITNQNNQCTTALGNAIYTIWNTAVHQTGITGLCTDIGFVLFGSVGFFIFGLYILYRKKVSKENNQLIISFLILMSVGLVLWLFMGRERLWYGIVFIFIYAICLGGIFWHLEKQIQKVVIFGLVVQLFICTQLAFLGLPSSRLSWTTGEITRQELIANDDWFDLVEKINALLENEPDIRIMTTPDQLAVGITQNHQTIIGDALGYYWAQVDYESKGDYNDITTILRQQKIKYITYMNVSDDVLRSFIDEADWSNYYLFNNLDRLQAFLQTKEQVVCTEIACIYKIY